MKRPFVLTLPDDGGGSRSLVKPPQAFNLRSGLVRLEPDRDVGLHSTGGNEEMLVILEGAGEVEAEGHGRRPVQAGQVVFIPPRTTHNVYNTDSAPLRYVYIVARAL